jgi:DNA-directed RNA polymerase specialized sigma24 family protein
MVRKQAQMLPFSELAEILPDGKHPEDDPLAALEEKLILGEFIAELPEPQRSYVRKRLTGVTVEKIAEQAGRSKSTVSEGLKRATGAMHKNVEEAIRYVILMVSILSIVKWVAPAIIALLTLLEMFFG